jgi:hypothetical protein
MNRLVMIVLAVFSILPAAAQKAHVDFDHACDFSHYQTYRWAGPPDLGNFNQLMQERVVGFVDEALSARRLKRVETGGDLLLSCRMDVRQQDVFTTFSDGFGWGWDGWGSSISTTTVQPWFFGTLTVDLVDARRKQLVFEGVSTASISSKPDHNTKRYAKVVNKIFDKYPPR